MRQFEVWLVRLDHVRGSEMANTRPCVVISPNRMKDLKTRIVAPLTRTQKGWWWRVPSNFLGVRGEIALDQMRSIDRKERALRRLGALDWRTADAVKVALVDMFSE